MMAFACGNGLAGPEFFLLSGKKKKVDFMNELTKYSPEAKAIMTPNGYMTDEAYIEWTEFFIEKISTMRGSPDDWALLVVDGYNSHVFCLKAL
jgi:hypothetical protein